MDTGHVAAPDEPPATFMQRMLDTVERVGNRVPHPVMIFVYLIHRGRRCRTSCTLFGAGASPTRLIDPETDEIELAHDALRAQPADAGRHPLHVHRRRPELHGLQRGRRDHRRHGGRRRRRGIGAGQGADPEAGDRGAAGGADLHPRLRRHPLLDRRRCRLPGADPAGRRGLSSASGGIRWPGSRSASPRSPRPSW